jgi:NAD(P)-dependent dehydrogenase (short-subunit alcohol dehydrogenase family)
MQATGHKIGTSERPDLRLAVVVGAGALGTAIARRMAQRYRVLLADIDGNRAEAEAVRMRAEGCDARAAACDITSASDVAALAAVVEERGGLGALVQVAGLSPSLADYRTIMRVNLMGAAMVAEALLPLALPGAAGVLIASLAAHSYTPSPEAQAVLRQAPAPDLAERLAAVIGDLATPPMAYTHSKYGLLMYARSQAKAWGERGARIVSLSPGMIATPQGALEFEKSEGKRKMYEFTALKRECTMQEIADAVEFLVSDRASFITGTDLLVDGGLSATMLG